MKTSSSTTKIVHGSSSIETAIPRNHPITKARPPKAIITRRIDSSKAIEREDIDSHYHAGLNCFMGARVSSDYLQAALHFEQGALQGDLELMKYLGQMYMLGLGVPLDETEGLRLLTHAASSGDSDAQYLVGEYRLSKHAIVPNPGIGIKWLLMAAELGDNRAQLMLGECYEHGNGVKVDVRKAFAWYRRAAQGEENLEATVRLGLCYLKGTGTTIDGAEAFHLFHSAAKLGSTHACYQLGMFYLANNFKDVRNAETAFSWFELGAVGGHDLAMAELSKCYMEGLGVKRDLRLASRWATHLLSVRNVTEVEFKLARLYSSMQC